MKKISILILLGLILGMFSFIGINQDSPYPAQYLIEPSELATIFNNPKAKQPLVFNVGAMPLIKNAKALGMGFSEEAIKELKTNLTNVGKNEPIIIYCGCCTMENCPNIKKPYDYLKSAGYTNFKILNIRKDLGHDWQDKGYPMNQ